MKWLYLASIFNFLSFVGHSQTAKLTEPFSFGKYIFNCLQKGTHNSIYDHSLMDLDSYKKYIYNMATDPHYSNAVKEGEDVRVLIKEAIENHSLAKEVMQSKFERFFNQSYVKEIKWNNKVFSGISDISGKLYKQDAFNNWKMTYYKNFDIYVNFTDQFSGKSERFKIDDCVLTVNGIIITDGIYWE